VNREPPTQSEPLSDHDRRIAALLASPAYRPADEDVEYLNGDDTRGIRLLLDYQKPETLLREQGIKHTVVVFGGTRIREPVVAQRQVDELQQQLNGDPTNQLLQQSLKQATRLLEKSHYYDVARELGRLVGEFGRTDKTDVIGTDTKRTVTKKNESNITLMTGGGPGIMEAANRGAFEAGAVNIGLNISLPNEQEPNAYLTPGLCFNFHYFATRKLHFLLRARALVAFPGGYGTLDELFDTLTLIQTRKIAPLPVVLVGKSFWQQALNIPFLVDEGVINSTDADLFWTAETASEIWQGILDWYQQRGSSLVE